MQQQIKEIQMFCLSKKYIILIVVSMVICKSSLLFAEGFSSEIGIKSNYSSGMSSSNVNYRLFTKLLYSISFFKSQIMGTFIGNEQITDGLGNFTTINAGQGLVKAQCNLGDLLELGGNYSQSNGSMSYVAYNYGLFGSLYINQITFDIDYSYNTKKYDYNGFININEHYFAGSFSYECNDNVDYELEYNYKANEFEELSYTYSVNRGRAGMSIYSNNSIYMGGVTLGKDSGDYYIIGGDFGFSVRFKDTIKLIALYALDYYNAPSVTTSTGIGGGHGGQSGTEYGYKGMNPYMRSDLIGKSFFCHSINVSLSFIF